MAAKSYATPVMNHVRWIQENKNIKFQTACRIWFCPSDAKIANELRTMPQKEREKVWADLSGNEKTSLFRKEVVENNDEIDKALDDLQGEIDSISNKEAFTIAENQSVNYVQDRAFRLCFIRSCEYDGKKAGRLLVDHMETKRNLFGNEGLSRDIQLSDLSQDDMDTLESGGIQFLRERDNAGRIILYSHVDCLKVKRPENFSRVLFYMLMSALKDTKVQKLGVILLWDMMSTYKGCYHYEADRMAIRTVGILPIRPVARYLLYESKLWDHVIDVLNRLITPHVRARTRSIGGSREEILHALSCLGIPYHCVPTDECGNMDLTNVKRWIDARTKKELKMQGNKRRWDRPWNDREAESEPELNQTKRRRKAFCS